jgi:ferrochelatase
MNKKTAIVLFNLGGPDKLQSVKPFLFNLFNDRAIINLPNPFRYFLAKLISSRREKKAQNIYKEIGGRSPILELTSQQAENLEKELSFHGDFKTFIAMRYWHPFAKETIKKILNYQPNQIILLPLYPQFSSSTSDSSINEFLEKFPQDKNKQIPIKTVCCYPNDENFINSHLNLIAQKLQNYPQYKISEMRFLFSAHGLPQKLIDAGDPYVFQIKESVDKISKKLQENYGEIDFAICYQSKVGPLQWTSPSLETELKRAILDKKIPVIIPIAFVSEHSETLVELDIEYFEMAEKLNAKDYIRIPALNSDSFYIKSLSEICLKISKENDGDFFCGQDKKRICPKKFKFCPNK